MQPGAIAKNNAEPRHNCRLCNRALRDPVSVKIGMGPICRAADGKQNQFDFMRAKTELLKHECGKYIFLQDVGHDSNRSVTGDVEYVIEQLYLEYDIADGTRIFYKDSEGNVDEILHSGKRFKGFKAGHEGIDLGMAADG